MGTVSQDILEKENIPEEHTRDTIIMIGKHLFRKVISPSNNLLSRSKNTYSGVTLPVLDNWVGITLTDLARSSPPSPPSGVSPTTSTLSAPATPEDWTPRSGRRAILITNRFSEKFGIFLFHSSRLTSIQLHA